MKRIVVMTFQKNEKKENKVVKSPDSATNAKKTMLLYEKLKKEFVVETPSVFSAILFLTCDVITNVPLKNISKETIEKRISSLATRGAKFSNAVRKTVSDYLLKEPLDLHSTREDIAKQVLLSAKYNDTLLMEDFNQYKKEICNRLDAPHQKFFKTICDLSCALVRSDTEASLFKNPEQRISDIEKNLNLKIDNQEREAVKKMMFSFKLDRLKSIYQSKLAPQERAKNDFVILKKMCRQAFIEMAGNRSYTIADKKRYNNSHARGR